MAMTPRPTEWYNAESMPTPLESIRQKERGCVSHEKERIYTVRPRFLGLRLQGSHRRPAIYRLHLLCASVVVPRTSGYS